VTTSHGVVSITAARSIPTAAGFTVSFDGSTIVITDDDGMVTVVDDLWDRAASWARAVTTSSTGR
jgi:hypothetical protein